MDLSSLKETDDSKEIAVGEETTYWILGNGAEVSALFSDITVDSVIAVTEDENNGQKIVVLEQTTDEVLAEEMPIFAEVTSVGEDGSLSLTTYVAADTEEEPNTVDYANIDWNNYVNNNDAINYSVPDDAVVQIVEEGLLTEANVSAIEEGDKLVIYLNEEGVQILSVYKAG